MSARCDEHATVYRYGRLRSDPVFRNGEVFITDDLVQDLRHGCSLVGASDAQCHGRIDTVAAQEVARVVGMWLRRAPSGTRGMLAGDYVEQAVYRVLGARHAGSFLASCMTKYA